MELTEHEVASAFVTSHTAVEKRIPRAKKVLAGSKTLFDPKSPAEFSARLPAVQRALYLLFNEGYHGASAESAIRIELCQEAMRLAALLLDHPLSNACHLRAFRADVPSLSAADGSPRCVGTTELLF